MQRKYILLSLRGKNSVIKFVRMHGSCCRPRPLPHPLLPPSSIGAPAHSIYVVSNIPGNPSTCSSGEASCASMTILCETQQDVNILYAGIKLRFFMPSDSTGNRRFSIPYERSTRFPERIWLPLYSFLIGFSSVSRNGVVMCIEFV